MKKEHPNEIMLSQHIINSSARLRLVTGGLLAKILLVSPGGSSM
ncbi:hypothetical protein [Escherichia phage 2G7b]|uniref:Uncharacterized protein n=1 Tax=Escherichia phage 2G7b TaxID=2847057 RepID=A0A653FRD1_9CAUD|nr:hypothetical protein H3V36_gp47 [Escherichia phage 2G7b]VUD36915.1 hypothetical protein [Escherichia phage 2G7b]